MQNLLTKGTVYSEAVSKSITAVCALSSVMKSERICNRFTI